VYNELHLVSYTNAIKPISVHEKARKHIKKACAVAKGADATLKRATKYANRLKMLLVRVHYLRRLHDTRFNPDAL
jgi:hypothetical protein